jgi:hypothetical protein
MHTRQLIAGIFNYCDRWCERCTFIDRCATGVIEQKRWAKGADWEATDLFSELEKLYPFSEDRVSGWLQDNAINPQDIEPDDAAELTLQTLKLEEEMQERGAQYYLPLRDFLAANEAEFKARGIDLFGEHDHMEGPDTQERSTFAESLLVIIWYQYFMFVKAGRAVSGLRDNNGPAGSQRALQSDANGSAKLAMIAAARSLGAWEMLRKLWPEKQQQILGFMREINGFRHRMERLFPHWQRFIRPGFDTEPPPTHLFGEN